jgi:hypothetical protein
MSSLSRLRLVGICSSVIEPAPGEPPAERAVMMTGAVVFGDLMP